MSTEAPAQQPPPPPNPLEETARKFEEGVELGRVLAEQAVRGLKQWVQKNPEQVLIAGVLAGFVLGKLLFPSRPPKRDKG
jgi:hypothetical protein